MSLENILFILVDYLDFESLNNLSSVIRIRNDIWTRFLLSKYKIYNEENPKEIYLCINNNSIPVSQYRKKKIEKYYSILNANNISRIFRFLIEYRYFDITSNKLTKTLVLNYIDYQGTIVSCYYNSDKKKYIVEQKDINYLKELILIPNFERFVNESIMICLSYNEILEFGDKILFTSLEKFHYPITLARIAENVKCNYEHKKELCLRHFNYHVSNNIKLKYAENTKEKKALYKYKQYYIYMINEEIKYNKNFSDLIRSLDNYDLFKLFGIIDSSRYFSYVYDRKSKIEIIRVWKDRKE